jgi:hypothetical protein
MAQFGDCGHPQLDFCTLRRPRRVGKRRFTGQPGIVNKHINTQTQLIRIIDDPQNQALTTKIVCATVYLE